MSGPRLRAELTIWRDLSRALDAWDRFDHAGVLGIIDQYSQRIGRVQPRLLCTLHGYDPISEQEWTRFADWLQESFMPLLEREVAAVGVRSVPDQLPTARCWRDAGP